MPDHGWIGTGLLFAFLFALAETGNSSGWAVIGDFFGRNSYASIRGAISFVQSAVSLPAPVMAGWVYDNTQSYEMALIPVLACYVMTFLLFWSLQRPKDPTPTVATLVPVDAFEQVAWGMQRSRLTPDEQELVARIDNGLSDVYPDRTFRVEARPIKPSPRGWLEVVVEEHFEDRAPRALAHEPVARHRITQPLEELAESLLYSMRQQVDHQRRN
jgi:hypothetical protein